MHRYFVTTDFTSPEYGKNAVVDTFENMLHRFMHHPEPKSRTCAGAPCQPHTRLLSRAHIIAGEHRRIGKETDRRYEEGDDLQALRHRPIEYDRQRQARRSDPLAIAPDELRQKIRGIGIRELIRFGCGQRILYKILRCERLSVTVVAEYERLVCRYMLSKRPRAKSTAA